MTLIDRIFKLHQILQQRKSPISGKELEQKLECSRATRGRVIDYMRDFLAAPIVYDHDDNGYYYDQNQAAHPYELPGLWFNAQELQALLACQHLLGNVSHGILQTEISQLQTRLEKLLSQNPGAVKPDLNKIKILNQANRRDNDQIFLHTAGALFNGKRLRIQYHARSQDRQSSRDISPQTLVRYRDNWYLFAHCHLRNEFRSFAMDRIDAVQTLAENADTFGEEILQAHYGDSYGIFSGSPKHTAVLEFSAERARWVADETWHPKQTGVWLEDGRYRLTLPYSDERELVMDILKHGAEVKVIAPAALVEIVRNRIGEMRAVYGD